MAHHTSRVTQIPRFRFQRGASSAPKKYSKSRFQISDSRFQVPGFQISESSFQSSGGAPPRHPQKSGLRLQLSIRALAQIRCAEIRYHGRKGRSNSPREHGVGSHSRFRTPELRSHKPSRSRYQRRKVQGRGEVRHQKAGIRDAWSRVH